MEMMGPDEITGWESVDFANAQLDDFRPLYAVLAALEERAMVVGATWWSDIDFIYSYNRVASGYQNVPTIEFLHRRIAYLIYEMIEKFVNLEPAVPYETNHYQDFPVYYTEFDIANSEHPIAVLPWQGSTANTPGALQTYRRFLEDAKFWLGKMRYVYAREIGATKRLKSSGSYWHGWDGSLEEDFRENIEEIRVGRFSNGAEVYGDWAGGTYSGELRVYYENDGRTVSSTETSESESARGMEYSGVWVGNKCPIPADVIVFWGFGYPFMNETQDHPGTYEEVSKAGCEIVDQKHAEGLWGSTSKVVLDRKTEDGMTRERKWTYSPDGTQSKETSREWQETTPSGLYLWEHTTERIYTGEGWTYAVDERTDFGQVEGGGSLLILPEKSTLELPPRPNTSPPQGGGFPYREKSVNRELNVGPITMNVVLDYGPYYKFP